MSRSSPRSIVITLVVAVALLSPDTFAGNLMQTGALALFALLNWRTFRPKRDAATVLFAAVFSLSLLHSLLEAQLGGTWQAYTRSFMVLCFFLFFPVRVHGYELDRRLLTAMLLLLTASQVVLMFDVNPLSHWARDVYYSNKALPTYSADGLLGFFQGTYRESARGGGFVGNPNQAAKFANLLLACYLLLPSRQSRRSTDVLFASLYSFSLLATGSRTGFLVTLALLLAPTSSRKGTRWQRFGLGLVVLSFVAYLVSSGAFLRSTSFKEGLQDSFALKVELLVRYLQVGLRPIVALLGNFFADTGPLNYPSVFRRVTFGFDADMGYFVYAFGFLGVTCLVTKIAALARDDPALRTAWPMTFWCFGASVFFHFRFLILLTILLSLASSTCSRPPLVSKGPATRRDTMAPLAPHGSGRA